MKAPWSPGEPLEVRREIALFMATQDELPCKPKQTHRFVDVADPPESPRLLCVRCGHAR